MNYLKNHKRQKSKEELNFDREDSTTLSQRAPLCQYKVIDEFHATFHNSNRCDRCRPLL